MNGESEYFDIVRQIASDLKEIRRILEVQAKRNALWINPDDLKSFEAEERQND